MKVALSTLNAVDRSYTPLALLCLKAYLVERCGWKLGDVPILEFTPEDTADDIVRALLDAKPKVIGFSCYVWNVVTLLQVAERIKRALPDTPIILGGPEVGPVSRSVLEANPYVDVIVKSEGEIPFSEIVMGLKSGKGFQDVQGITYRRHDAVIENPNAPILQDLNVLPSPHQPDYGDYSGRSICLETQRGCVFQCSFCFYNKDFSIRNRRFDLERVKRDILYWLQKDVCCIYLMDPIFNLNVERAKEICRFILRHNHRNVAFRTEIWAEFVDEETAQLFRDANFTGLEVGLQSSDQTVLNAVDRPFKVGKFVPGFQHLRKYNLRTELQLILGLPGQTLESVKASLDFAASLDPYCLNGFVLQVLPGTELRKKAEILGLVYDREPPYTLQSTPDLPEDDIRKARILTAFVEILRKSIAIQLLCKEYRLALSALAGEMIESEDPFAAGNPKVLWTPEWGEWVQGFIRDFCIRKGTDPDFYIRFFGMEYPRCGPSSTGGLEGVPVPGRIQTASPIGS